MHAGVLRGAFKRLRDTAVSPDGEKRVALARSGCLVPLAYRKPTGVATEPRLKRNEARAPKLGEIAPVVKTAYPLTSWSAFWMICAMSVCDCVPLGALDCSDCPEE